MNIDDIVKWTVETLSKVLVERNDDIVNTPEMDHIEAVKAAHRDWILAQKRFEWVTDPELVDQAIYAEVAAQKRYTYLLKKAKEIGKDFTESF